MNLIGASRVECERVGNGNVERVTLHLPMDAIRVARVMQLLGEMGFAVVGCPTGREIRRAHVEMVGVCGHTILKDAEWVGDDGQVFCSPACADAKRIVA